MKRYWLIWTVIILSVVILRLPVFLSGFANIDENEYAIAAQKILEGGLPYHDFLIYQPPVIYYFYTLAFKIFGNGNLWGVHILLYGVVIASLIFIYLIAKNIFSSKRAGLLAAVFYAFLSFAFIPQDMLAANCEIIAVLPIVIGVWCLSNSLFLMSGFFIGIAALTKYQCGIVIIPILIYLLFVWRKFFNVLTASFGFLIPLFFTIFLLWKGGGWKETKEAWLYILQYAKGPVQNDVSYLIIKFIGRTFLIAFAGLGVWYLAFRGSIDAIRRRPFLFLWLAFSFIPIILGGRMYFHYYFVLLPPICILAAGRLLEVKLSKSAAYIFMIWGIISVIGFFVYDIYKPYRKLTVKDDWIYAVDYLKNNSKPGDSVFVWGCCPQIYISSGLATATRFTTADYLTGRSSMTAGLEYDPKTPHPPSSFRKFVNDFIDPPGVVIFDTSTNIFPKAWEYLEKDFSKSLPTYIVDTVSSNYRRYGRYPISNYPFLYEILTEKYYVAEDIRGYKIYKLRE